LDRRLGPESQTGRCGEERKKSLTLPGIELQSYMKVMTGHPQVSQLASSEHTETDVDS